MLNLVKNEDEKLFQSIILNFIKYSTTGQIYERSTSVVLDNLELIGLYGDILFSLCKGLNDTTPKKKESVVIQTIEKYVLTNEVAVYKKFKLLQ